ncbi:Fe-S-containing protein [Candidatus Binatus sp.]|uniref:Fe-S-containing protein n=1 Tax=Candidatus Binatus sp. TaxID=2811406 RepID=UPI003BCF9B11
MVRPTRLKILGGLVLAAGAAASLIFIATSNCTTVTGTDEVAVNVSAMRPGSARLFCYTDDAGKRLRFVLARGRDGKVRSVFDACRQCFAFHRGYRLVGGELICRECGNHYSIDRMTEGKASCVPVSLPHEDDSGIVHIKTADLKAGHGLF